MAKPIETVFRDFSTDGNPSTAAHEPIKSDIRDLLNAHLINLTGATSGAIVKTSLADPSTGLNADLAHDADTMAWVVGDSTQGNDGVYQKQGASGAGSWARLKGLPYNVIQLNNANAGTANAIQATTSVNVPDAAYGALLVLNITADNTGSVTLSVNNETARSVVTNTNAAITSGYFVSGMAVLCVDDGTNYRLLSYGDASAVQAAAEAAQAAAEAAAASVTQSFIEVATRTAMAALSSTVSMAYLTEEGREGFFKRTTGDYSDTTIDVSQGIIIPTTANPTTEAYVRLNPEFISPGMFGIAAGLSTGDHAQEMEDMIWALNNGYGKKHWLIDRDVFSNGGYFIGTEFPHGVLIEGRNNAGFVEVSTAPTAQLLHFNNPINNLTIRNINFRNLNATQRSEGNQAIGMNDAGSNIVIEDCEISGFSYGIWVNNAGYITIQNNYIHDLFADGIHLGGGTRYGKILNNTVQTVSDDMIACTTDTFSGNSTIRTSHIIISGNDLDNALGAYGNGIALYNCDEITVSNNTMTNIQGNGVSLHTNTAEFANLPAALKPYCRRCKVSDNFIYNVGLAQTDLDSNNLSTNKGHGHGIYLDGGWDIDITNNYIQGVGSSPNPYRAGLFMTSDTSGYGLYSVRIIGNTIEDISGSGMHGFSTGSGNGCERILVDSCYFENITSWAINWSELYFDGAVTIRDTTGVQTDTVNTSQYISFNAGTTTVNLDTSGNLAPSGHQLSLGGNAASWGRRTTTNTF